MQLQSQSVLTVDQSFNWPGKLGSEFHKNEQNFSHKRNFLFQQIVIGVSKMRSELEALWETFSMQLVLNQCRFQGWEMLQVCKQVQKLTGIPMVDWPIMLPNALTEDSNGTFLCFQMHFVGTEIRISSEMRDLSADVRLQSTGSQSRWEAPLLALQTVIQESLSEGQKVGQRQEPSQEAIRWRSSQDKLIT